ncbi:folylpolyglutamate synthase, mitochondrial-like isoform X2 [Lineus longissimus]|uniref:folylpolyglutamate synthase, mitochondrial-like isoform X2 n=1 Tax=Lineus longissimus TaxID=88925 RepID=UPI002B4EDE99
MHIFMRKAFVTSFQKPQYRVLNTFLNYMNRQHSTQICKQPEIMTKNYEEAVRALNTLQSNAFTLEKARKERDRLRHLNIPDTIRYCQRTGLSLDDVDKLSIIHVSGTKGKGSTCALTESILRHHGFKTGFFSSPHLLEVRERIRLNGRPLSRDSFSSYFWDCYKKLEDTKADDDNKMPAYFRFLTIMAFHVFLQEQVDVVILEVGIGGEFDCTNVIRSPVVCGITSLGLDHTSVLGDTIAKIAWQKAGILKPGFPALTVPQPEDGLEIIAERAKEKQCPLHVVPHLFQYNWQGNTPRLGLVGDMQQWNASLALQLSQCWMENHDKTIEQRRHLAVRDCDFSAEDVPICDAVDITDSVAAGLENCRWAGRNQTLRTDRITYYLDGAHTSRSIQQCVNWFLDKAWEERKELKGKVTKILLFNTTGDRQPDVLLEPLLKCNFDGAVFCPNIATTAQDHADQMNLMTTKDNQQLRCLKNKNAWVALLGDSIQPHPHDAKQDKSDVDLTLDCVDGMDIKETMPSVGGNSELKHDTSCVEVFPSLSDSLHWIMQGVVSKETDSQQFLPFVPPSLNDADHIQVLVTGSLHLIGCALKLLDPKMNDRDP